MKNDTKSRLIEEAEVLFSKNGFYGTSINDVAKTLGVSKQALLHHFTTKEKLYAAVLEQAANHLLQQLDSIKQNHIVAKQQLREFILEIAQPNKKQLRVIILLLRELLDNQERADKVSKWFLRPWLDSLVGIVEQAQHDGYYEQYDPMAFLYHLLGAVQYFLISQPTLKQLYGKEKFESHKKAHMALLVNIVEGTR